MADIQKLSVYDSRIVQEAPTQFAVEKGGLAVTNNPFKAIASTQSQASFNVQIPSLNVFVDRSFEFEAQVDFDLQVDVPSYAGAPAPATTPVLVFGRDCAFAPFPLSSLITTLTATINDTATTINLSDVLREIQRLIDTRENHKYRTTPYMLDVYADYNTGAGAINSNLSSYYEARYDDVPNGAFGGVQFLNPDNSNPLIGTGNYTFGGQQYDFVDGVPVLVNATGSPNALTTYPLRVRLSATEPLFLSPFIFNEECLNDTGLFSINNIQIVMNFGGANQVARVIRSSTVAGGANPRNISNVRFTNSPWALAQVNAVTITPSLDLPLPSKSVVEYLEYPRFITTGLPSVPSLGTATVRSQTITLPCVPDMLAIYVKPSTYGATDGDWYLPIRGLRLNFDNYSGLMSTTSTTQLFRMAVENGLNMDFNAWSGEGRVVNPKTSATGGNVQLVGGFLLLKFAKDVPLSTGTAPSVVGSFTLQTDLDIYNPHDTAVDPQIYFMTINSGYFESQSGSSRIIRGVLNESDVINAPLAPMGTRKRLQRMVGGGFFGNLGSALQKAGKMAVEALKDPAVRGMVKEGVKRLPGGREAVSVAEKFGLGTVTGGMATGGRSRNARLSALM